MDFKSCEKLTENISSVIIGKKDSIELLLVALISEGHVLIEDVPGVGKTLLAKSLSKSIGGTFHRVQFTPDLLPADITGFNVYNQQNASFDFQPGPVITNILLADEINRTVPRTQSSLLEAMEERQVTIDGFTHALPSPFFVMATQNPIELEGTFPLPEAQLDRFILKIHLGYPDRQEEIDIMKRFQKTDPYQSLQPVMAPDDIKRLQDNRRNISVSDTIRSYISDIVMATRNRAELDFGVSPRGSLGLMKSAQALAGLKGRDYVTPDDVKYLTIPALAHRIVLQEAEKMKGNTAERILSSIVESIPVPVYGE